MRRAPNGRDTTDGLDPASDATDGDVPRTERGDWAARHARTRPASETSIVRAEEPGDDWTARHGRTRRT
jgi:hypothetical protein